MIGRQKRLHEAFEHLRKFFGIHTQTDFAEVLKYSRVYISSALNGNEKNLTDKLFTNICEAYPGVFNLNYLLTGEGDLLALEEEVSTNEFEKQMTQQSNLPPATDQTYFMSKVIESIETSHAKQVASLEHQVSLLEQQLADKNNQIASLEKDKEELRLDKESLNRRVRELESRLFQYESGHNYDNFPFPQGVAEKDDIKSTRV